jgi:cysteine desulfurase/selenocysteine lyase
MDIQSIRKDFPQLSTMVHGKPLVYLDNAATTLKPSSVIDAIHFHYSQKASNIHRGIHHLSEEGTFHFEQTRDCVQKFINAKNRHEVIFTKGTTDSINLVAHSFGELLHEGDEIILSMLEHHSNIVPWQLMAQKKKAIIKVIPINLKGELILDEYEKLLTPKTKIVAINAISNALGTINPIEEVIKKAHHVGAKVLIDAAQAVLHMPLDVQKLDCDFLVFSMHKLLGPTGVGVLYGKESLLDQMPPYQGGGDMIDVVSFEKTTFNDLPHKFEAGTPHIAGVIASKAAIEYVNNLGFANIQHQEEKLLHYATKELSSIEGLTLIGTAEKKASVVSFTMKGLHPQDIATYIDRQGVAIRTGHHCTQPLMKFFNVAGTCRASFAFYNQQQEIDILKNSLLKCQELFL